MMENTVSLARRREPGPSHRFRRLRDRCHRFRPFWVAYLVRE